ncbi:hypothetical protein ACLEXX_02035 [Enterobacter ludwigii]|uniref:hypothetical protein n=1 Tax=Enterobacter ludwigii TaxID=299767 RepID=UPI003976BDB8
MTPEKWSAIAGCASAFAAIISLVITTKGLKSQNESLKESKRRNIQDLLASLAQRANASVKERADANWSFAQFANVMLSIDTAKTAVERIDISAGISKEEASDYFKNLLDHQIISSFRAGQPPDGAFKEYSSIDEALVIVKLWNPNAHFLGFTDVNFIIS